MKYTRKTKPILSFILIFATMIMVLGSCTSAASGPIDFAQLISQANKYNGQTVTLDAYYFDGFEISAICGSLIPSSYYNGRVVPDGTLIWAKGGITQELQGKMYSQTVTPSGYPEHFAKLRITGKFETDSKYGHLDAYQYQINITSAEMLEWSPTPVTSPASTDGNLQVKVTDINGQPLSGGKVVSEEQPNDQLKVTGLSNESGLVIFNNIKSGEYKFYVNRFDYVQKEMTVTVIGGQTTSITVELVKAE